jgi:hypothetical protein
MTNDELKAIEARANAATPGLEVVYEGDAHGARCAILHDPDRCCVITVDKRREFEDPKPEGEFIAHARTDIPDLIAEVRRLREALEFYAHPEVGLFDSRDVIKGYVICRKCNTRMDTLLSTERAHKALGSD